MPEILPAFQLLAVLKTKTKDIRTGIANVFRPSVRRSKALYLHCAVVGKKVFVLRFVSLNVSLYLSRHQNNSDRPDAIDPHCSRDMLLFRYL